MAPYRGSHWLTPLHPLLLASPGEGGQEKKLWSQSWHSKCTLHSRSVWCTKLILKPSKYYQEGEVVCWRLLVASLWQLNSFFSVLGNVSQPQHVHSLLCKGYIKPGAESWRYGVFYGCFFTNGLLHPADLFHLLLHAGPPEAGASARHVVLNLAVWRRPPRSQSRQRQCTQLCHYLLWEITHRDGYS